MAHERIISYPGISGEIKGSGIYEPNIGCGSFNLLTDKENIIKDIAKNYEKQGIEKVTYVTDLPPEYFENTFEKYFGKGNYDILSVETSFYNNEFRKRIIKSKFKEKDIEKLINKFEEDNSVIFHSITVSDPEIPEEIEKKIKKEEYDSLFARSFATLFGINKKGILSSFFGDLEGFRGYVSNLEALKDFFEEKDEILVIKKGDEKYAGGNNTLLITYKDLDSEDKRIKKFVDSSGVFVYEFDKGFIFGEGGEGNKNTYRICSHFRLILPEYDPKAICIKMPLSISLNKCSEENLEEAIEQKIKNMGVKRRGDIINSSSGKSITIIYENKNNEFIPTLFFERKILKNEKLNNLNEFELKNDKLFGNLSDKNVIEKFIDIGKGITLEIQEKINKIIRKYDASTILTGFKMIEELYKDKKYIDKDEIYEKRKELFF